MRAAIAILPIAGWQALFAQSPAALPGCEPRPEVRQILEEKLSDKTLQEMKFAERVAFRRQTLDDLIAMYPREVEPYRRLIRATKEEDTDRYPALVEGYRKQAEQHPDDPLALYVAGLALSGIDTPQSIRCLEMARAEAPDFVWPALELAQVFRQTIFGTLLMWSLYGDASLAERIEQAMEILWMGIAPREPVTTGSPQS